MFMAPYRPYTLTAYSENHDKLFMRYCASRQECFKQTVNNPLLSKVAFIQINKRVFALYEVYKILHNLIKPTKDRSV